MADKSYTIDKVGWHTQTPGNPESVERIHLRFRTILNFLQSNGLTKQVIWRPDQLITDETCLHTDHLTNEGRQIVDICYDKWLKGVDRGQSPSYLKRWEKALEYVLEL